MAPFSYFRNQHRRSGSTPNSESPRSPQWKGPSSPFGSGAEDSTKSPASFRHSAIPSPTVESPVSPLPPVLPPIRRIASKNSQEQTSHEVSKSDSAISKDSPRVDKPKDAVNVELPSATPPILPRIPRIVTRRNPRQEPLKIRTTDTMPETNLRRKEQLILLGDEVEPPLLIHPKPRVSSSTPTESNQRVSRKPVPDTPPLPSQDSTPRPATPPILHPTHELHPPRANTSRRASSPSSSLSSFQKSISSSSFGIESSPASSKSAQASNSTGSRTAKPRMTLLNPVSLLRRRRTAQHVENMSDHTIVPHHNLDVPAMSLPEDYDPRIKGKGVHDFNAPRPRRHHSTNDVDSSNLQTSSNQSPVDEHRSRSGTQAASVDSTKPGAAESNAPKNSEPDRVTVFHENFDDNADDQTNTSGVTRESLANSSFLARMSRRLEFDAADFTFPNADSPPDSQQQQSSSPAGERTSKSTVGAPSVRISSDQSTARSSISNETRDTSPPGSPPSKNQRGSLNLEPPFQPEGLPKHFSSSASRTSRFSFQLNSEATLAEEKALEDKGKEKAAKAQQLGSDEENGYGNSSDDDVTNYGDMDDDDLYEEEIPMVNAVDDDDPNEWSYAQSNSTQVFDGTSTQTNHHAPETQTTGEEQNVQNVQPSSDTPRQATLNSEGSVDSMYFDDGLIDDPSPNASRDFDESYFDSPVEDLNNATATDAFARSNPSVGTGGILKSSHSVKGLGIESGDNLNDQSFVTGKVDRSTSDPTKPGSAHLGKLDAYHDALATAATRAEADGRFRRKPSVDVSISDIGSDAGARFSSVSGFDVAAVDWSQGGFDDGDLYGLEDDQMVAAANAEVLASEDSDFYGREFGFYGTSSDLDGEMHNGGYFGVATDDLKRSACGMNAVREPNLTPITERSEFSTRNSFISLHGYGSNPSAPNSAISRNDMSLPSPGLGLREIAASMNMDEDDMTLTQLIRLRKETFGASGGNTMASPSTSLPNGSPLAMHSPPPVQTVQEEEQEEYEDGWSSEGDDENNDEQHHEETSNPNTLLLRSPPATSSSETTPKRLPATTNHHLSLTSNGTSTGSSPLSTPNTAFLTSMSSSTTQAGQTGSPSTLPSVFYSPAMVHSAPTSPMPMPSPSLMHKFAARPPASSASYAERHRQRHSLGNASTTGTGDSVAYVMEDSKWFLERRRRLSSGELIVVGRELVEGGRI